MVGGGTAGHVLPALPVIERFLAAGDEVSFVGTRSGLEEQWVTHLPLKFYGISSGKLRRYFSWQNFTDVFRIGAGLLQSIGLMRRVKPDVVFSKGGFVSFPVVVAAWLCRIPVVAHESDLTPGLANRLAAPFVKQLCVSFAPSASDPKVVHTGTPIRQEILAGDAARGREKLGLNSEQPLLIVTGGSLGADKLNQTVREAMAALADQFFVLHVCGPGKQADFDHVNYQQLEYVSDGWGDMLAAADVVVSRAGANALFELLALKKRSLLVPLSAEASRGDQIQNARWAADQGLAAVLKEADLDPGTLVSHIANLNGDSAGVGQALRGYAYPDAAAEIETVIRNITNSHADGRPIP